MSDSFLKIGIVGVGHMGRFHLQKFLKHPRVKVVGFLDTNEKNSQQVIDQFQVRSFKNLTDLFFECGAVCVSSPTATHFGVVRQALESGLHVLVEKPMSETAFQAQLLIEMAAEKKRLVQVGFLERFRFNALAKGLDLKSISSIEARRTTLRPETHHNIDVISDLMIHDIDLASHLMDKKAVQCGGTAANIHSNHYDVADIRIEFEGGGIAHFNASRGSFNPSRQFRFLAGDVFVSMDFMNNRRECFTRSGVKVPALANIELGEFDALASQTDAFVSLVLESTPVVVSGTDGLNALRLVEQIKEKLETPFEQVLPGPLQTSPTNFGLEN